MKYFIRCQRYWSRHYGIYLRPLNNEHKWVASREVCFLLQRIVTSSEFLALVSVKDDKG